MIYAALFTGCAQLSKLLVGFVLLKMIAYYFGAAGLGELGHFMSLVSIVAILAGGGITSGIIKYASEYKLKPKKLVKFISASVVYSLISSLFVFVVCITFSSSISVFVFGGKDFFWIIVLLAFAQLGFAFTNLVTGVANGLGNTKIYAVVQISGNAIGLPLAYVLMQRYQIEGAALAILAILFVQIFPAYYFFHRDLLRKHLFRFKTESVDYKKLARFTVMLLVSIMAFPVVEIFLRQQLISEVGYFKAGIWQGALKLSNAYLSFFGVFLAYSFMPVISRESDKEKITQHVFRILFIVMGGFFLCAIIFFTFRSFFIPLLLSKDFELLQGFIGYQLVGDFFKIASQVIGFVAVAKAAMRVYIFAEIFQSIGFLGFVSLMKYYFPTLESVFLGYMSIYIIYFIISFSILLWWLKNDTPPAVRYE